ncbi:MAG: M28 family peptidase [Planctomycetia bacterium]|nr:M28 family peptidase [Planctomycetia bacterium]
MSEPFAFDGERAYQHTAALCYPRRVGTRLERRAARYILRAFAALGMQWRRERFRVSHLPTALGSRVAFVLSGTLILLAALTVEVHPLLAALAFALAGFLVVSPWRVGFSIGESWPPLFTSHNVIASPPTPVSAAPARVIFMAHYDTKSQLIPTGVRVALVFAVAILSNGLAVYALAAALGYPGLLGDNFTDATAILAQLCLAVLVANYSGNRSPGALDNGSAVGTLLELARSWQPKPSAPLDVLWVASGSEETGLNGARCFLARHGHLWKEKPTLLINLESVGAGPRLYLAGESAALKLAQATADALGMPHHRLRVVGAGMDHEPFAARNLPSVTILGDVVRASWAMHTTRDNLELIERPPMERAARLAAHLAWNWADLHRPPTVPAHEEPVLPSVFPAIP